MDTFGFTKKKWRTLPQKSQLRHLIKWLTHCYEKLATNRISPKGRQLFAAQYNKVMGWTGLPAAQFPDPADTRAWLEAVSDLIQSLRLAAGKPATDVDLLKNVHINDRSAPLQPRTIDCHLALDGLRSLFNVGAMFRICDAAGFSSLILGRTLGKENPRVQKTAMGAQNWVIQEKTDDLYTALLAKKAQGYQVVGIETMDTARSFDEIIWTEKTVVVLGNEEYGISSHTLPACDAFAYIPMHGRKNSINVACAASVICFHIAGALAAKANE